MGREIQAGRVWTNCYHAYPAHAAFGGYKQSGIGRETHKMMLNHYRQVKNLHVSYSEKKLGFFLTNNIQWPMILYHGPKYKNESISHTISKKIT